MARLVGAAAAVVAVPALLKAAIPSVGTPIGAPAVVHVPQVFKRGDVFTIEGKYALNPMTLQPTGLLERFVVVDDCTDEEIVGRPESLIYPRIRSVKDRTAYPTVSDSSPFTPAQISPVLWPAVIVGARGEPSLGSRWGSA